MWNIRLNRQKIYKYRDFCASLSFFLPFLHRISLFYAKIAMFLSFQLAIIVYALNKIMNEHCANFYSIESRNRKITNIFQFLTIFAQNFSILPHNITFLTNSAKRHRYFLLYIFMNNPCTKVYII